MREIPEDIINDVNNVVDKLVVYKNKKGLSWISSYNDVLDNLGMSDRKEDVILLKYVVSKITRLGYDNNFIERVSYLVRYHDSLINPNELDNDIEMVILAFSKNEKQNYQTIRNKDKVSEALGKGN